MKLFDKIKSIFLNKEQDEKFEELEDILLEADIPYEIVNEILDEIKKTKTKDEKEIILKLKNTLKKNIKSEKFELKNNVLNIILIIGVNGVGKTSTIAKMAKKFKDSGKNVLISAADTFRAAAIEQLKIHGDKIEVKVIAQEQGSDPSAVIFDSISSAKNKNYDVLIIDTAGRLQNKENLIKELEKMQNVIKKQIENENVNYKKILVIDSITGKNAINQAEIFNNILSLDGIILTKFDSSSKAGGVISISIKCKIPFYFITFGENLTDIKDFSYEDYFKKLL